MGQLCLSTLISHTKKDRHIMLNLIEGIQAELERNRELLKDYLEIPTGAFGATMIKLGIEAAEKAIAQGDTVQMLRCYNELKESK